MFTQRSHRRIVPRSVRHSKNAEVASLQGIIAASLYFDELLHIIPMTGWWHRQQASDIISVYSDAKKWESYLDKVLISFSEMLDHWSKPVGGARIKIIPSAFDRYTLMAGMIMQFMELKSNIKLPLDNKKNYILKIKEMIPNIKNNLIKLYLSINDSKDSSTCKNLHQVSLNRPVSMALSRSVKAVKADAARLLFKIDCSRITWAVIDSGIKADHSCFRIGKDDSRVLGTFDFSNFRYIVSRDNARLFASTPLSKSAQSRLTTLKKGINENQLSSEKAIELLMQIGLDQQNKHPIRWELVTPFIALDRKTPPEVSDHGTHVAGILGASSTRIKSEEKSAISNDEDQDDVDGVCPDIRLYDFRVISDNPQDTEFAVIGALQYIRYLNARTESVTIHGANLSLSIPHNVQNYACGRTPICLECERLVDSGVVVVSAAGNLGRQRFVTQEGLYEGYATLSVTDPGNADGVITVGSTHRFSPHTYGVSFFSSRGPTGDGRLKPDLVAPGEHISAPFRENWGVLDGTSMAAPHVSGAAAMLMARYPELIGQPRRIKKILCESATDLGRERNFQGHGMLDVLRALQSI